jgi:hypothetical protein
MATGSPGIFPKAEGNIIYAADYNNVQGTANFLLGTGLADSGYGQTVTSGQVDATLKVTAAQWVDLRTDLLKIRQHQTGVDESAGLGIANTSLLVDDTFVNTFKTFATTCNTNRLTIATNQGTAETLAGAGQTRTTAWNGVVSHTVTITFASSNAARHFFNAGGEIRFSGSRSGGSTTNKNTSWTNLLSDMGTIKFGSYGTTYTGTGAAGGYPTTGIGWYGLTTSYQTVFVKPAAAGVYLENDYNIQVKKNAADNTATTLTFEIQFRDDDSGDPPTTPLPKDAIPGGVDEDINGTLTSTVQLFRPSGANVALSAPTASSTVL